MKTTVFISTHASFRDFWAKDNSLFGNDITLSNFRTKILSIVGDRSELIIFDSSCWSVEHADIFNQSNLFPKTTIYIGGTCKLSKHVFYHTPKYLFYENLMEPILNNYEYPFEKTNQKFDSFEKSILSVKTFTNLEKNLEPVECSEHSGAGCIHFKTHILKRDDLSIYNWFEFSAEQPPKLFLQFWGYKFQYLNKIVWGYHIFLKTQEKYDLLLDIFDPEKTKFNAFEVLDITDWSESKTIQVFL